MREYSHAYAGTAAACRNRGMWERREVSELTFSVRRLRHPELGVRSFLTLILLVAGADTVGVVVHVPTCSGPVDDL